MQPDRATNNCGRPMEVVAIAPRCQLLLIVLMAAMLLPGMKVSPLLVRRKITRTTELQESIGKVADLFSDLRWLSGKLKYTVYLIHNVIVFCRMP
ncbi:hypothetical protein STEG23_012955 [Scotinomys teguina]